MNVTIKLPAGSATAKGCEIIHEDGTPLEMGISKVTIEMDWKSQEPVKAVVECVGMGLNIAANADVRVLVHGKQYRLVPVED